MDYLNFLRSLNDGIIDSQFSVLYNSDDNTPARQKKRYTDAVNRFIQIYSDRSDIHVFSAPGRSEIGGNHTDHQHGCALGAAVDLDMIAVVSFHDDGVIRLYSEGYSSDNVDLSDLSVHDSEKGKSVSIVRGIASYFMEHGADIKGFDAYVVSDVLGGSGLSSSAAFETLIAAVIDIYYNEGKTKASDIAKIGKYAENVYFGKSSGLLDQMVCSTGGFVFMDFKDPLIPYVEKYDIDFRSIGYDLCITDTKGSHSDLTEDYVCVSSEMKSVAAEFGAEVLGDVDEDSFYNNLPLLHNKVSDRALLRALHFFEENRRARNEAKALKEKRFDDFFMLFDKSAYSSTALLQNLYSVKRPLEQGIPLAIELSRMILGNDAHVRVHGGGFAGTVQALVPCDKTQEYRKYMDSIFGDSSCYVLSIRPLGGVEIKG